MRPGVLLICWLILAPPPTANASLVALIARTIDLDETCGSIHDRRRDREACAEESWRARCEELRDALSDTGRVSPTGDTPLDGVDDQTERFVGEVTHDLLCRVAEPADDDPGAESRPTSKWDHLDSIHRQRAVLNRAARSFAAELASASARIAGGLADLHNGVSSFRTARELGVGTADATDELRDRFRFVDDDGDDLTEYVYLDLVERAESCVDEVREFERVFEGRPLAALELAQNRARLLNSLRLLDWGLANFESNQVVHVPAWLTAGEVSTAGAEITVRRTPKVFLVGTGLSPLSRPAALPEVQRQVASFLEVVEDGREGEPSESTCRALARAVNALERESYVELERLLGEANRDGYRSVRSELFALDLLGTISRGNRGLVDSCAADRDDARWHRRFMQQTVDLTRALNPGAGRRLRSLLRNSFSERIE